MAIRDTTYYGWEDLYVLQSKANEVLSGPSIVDAAHCPATDRVYLLVRATTYNPSTGESTGATPMILRSEDKGLTWERILRIESLNHMNGIACDAYGSVYVCGHSGIWDPTMTFIQDSFGAIWKSETGETGSFYQVDAQSENGDSSYGGITVDRSTGNIYAVLDENGNALKVRASTTGESGSFVDYFHNVPSQQVNAVDIEARDGRVACTAVEFFFPPGLAEGQMWLSEDGTSGSFTQEGGTSSVQPYVAIAFPGEIHINKDKTVFYPVVVDTVDPNQIENKMLSHSVGDSFAKELETFASGNSADNLCFGTSDNAVYWTGISEEVFVESNQYILRSEDGTSGSFIERLGWTNQATSLKRQTFATSVVDDDDTIYIFFRELPPGTTSEARVGVKRGRRVANSASLAPRMLGTSFGYVHAEPTGTLQPVEKFKLNNVSEFSHGGGIGQMRNLVLGTVESGKIGKDDDSLIQVRQFGSIVRVFWPRQDSTVEEVPIRGYGDASIGQRAGKLLTGFEPGDIHDVTEHDHLALYCYLTKAVSGTLDDVEIRIERRPLKSTGFAVDQAIEYETSGSVTVAKLRDLIYKKEIDYGDLSMREIGFPIDVPLSNVKEVRISCKQSNGQSLDENKNFIVWGRLIKSEEET